LLLGTKNNLVRFGLTDQARIFLAWWVKHAWEFFLGKNWTGENFLGETGRATNFCPKNWTGDKFLSEKLDGRQIFVRKTGRTTNLCSKNWTGDKFLSQKLDGRLIFWPKNWTGDNQKTWTGKPELSPVLLRSF